MKEFKSWIIRHIPLYFFLYRLGSSFYEQKDIVIIENIFPISLFFAPVVILTIVAYIATINPDSWWKQTIRNIPFLGMVGEVIYFSFIIFNNMFFQGLFTLTILSFLVKSYEDSKVTPPAKEEKDKVLASSRTGDKNKKTEVNSKPTPKTVSTEEYKPLTEEELELAKKKKANSAKAQKAIDSGILKVDYSKKTDVPAQSSHKVTSFDSIAGYEETKKNMKFVVEMIKDSQKYLNMGVKPPSGIILYGPPGTGKTLMASAIASESNLNFITRNASSFVNTFVGTGASAVRELYEEARENTPCVVFIDELDAVGGKRGNGQNQEYQNTINALLSELDGLSGNSGIITIAATNMLESLDEALIRPGRFDRKIAIPLPNVRDREKILKIHTAKKKLGDDINLSQIAIETEGFSGATLATLINESAIIAVQLNKPFIEKKELDKALMKIITNGESTPLADAESNKIIAWHEAGHALALKVLCGSIVSKVTIRGSTSGFAGVTLHSNPETFNSRRKLEQSIKSVYAGRCAETLYFGNDYDITSGASADLVQATKLIKEYNSLYGSTLGSGLLDYNTLTNSSGISSQDYENCENLASKLFDETLVFLTDNKNLLEKIAEELLKKESLSDSELSNLIRRYQAKNINKI